MILVHISLLIPFNAAADKSGVILLMEDHTLGSEERRSVAFGLLKHMRKYDDTIPILTPREEDYVRNERNHVCRIGQCHG